ncbi:MAG: AAA family ATPase, partial [Actinobacteria bacterium]|nr:AAA family ATPase [Actinomycetota bacterium]
MTTWPTPNGSGANGSAGNGHSTNGNGHASSTSVVSAPRRKRRKQGIKRAKPGCRRPLMMYDRVKVSLLLLGIFLLLSLLKMADNPLVSFVDGVRMTFNSYGWILTLVSLDVLRQMHYLAAERFPGYWSVVGRAENFVKKPWNRLSSFTQYRLSRILRVAMIIVVGAFLFSAAFDTEPIRAWMEALVRLWQAVPTILQFVAYLLLAIGQFVAIFWFLSKGGVEVLMPEDIKTSFDDVWGQDQVVGRVKETLSLLEDPDLIEAKGGYVPGGILLYGPPGTGKTLIAEALAGETGKPFVLIEPGAFQAMFIGVNILKVKSLYRRLRKLALRYGGVVAFFDEADVLGRRAMSTGGQGGLRTGALPISFGHDASYDSLSYLSPVSQSVVLGHYDSMVGAKTDRLVVPGGGGDLGTLNAILASMQGLKKPRGFINRIKRALGMKPSNPPKYRILHVMA